MKAIQFISEIIEHKEKPRIQLGMMSSHRWRMDPKVLLFSMARYKFVAKMLSNFKDVIEIGCGDCWGTQIVLQEVGNIRAFDLDPMLIEENLKHLGSDQIQIEQWDFCKTAVRPKAHAAYLLDVLEHIPLENEADFLHNIADSIRHDGVCIIGMPSLESQKYASVPSKKSHINCKSGPDLKKTLDTYFKNVFMFSMHDEVIHTGFLKMAHYLLALCVGIRV
jgi:2-polyprenyl-3-methyl-5-hydroxy-6-metoxy-1,4-benzoquinol methylase